MELFDELEHTRSVIDKQAPPRIVVVGGGTAAACFLIALSLHLRSAFASPGEIVVYEPRTHLWRGRVYQPDGSEIITNVPASAMSLHYDDPDHATRWLAARLSCDDAEAGTRFIPRALMGEYLVAEVEAARRRLSARGWSVRVVPEKVMRIAGRDHSAIVFGQHTTTACHSVVLCVGGSDNADPYNLSPHPAYIGHPYPVAESLRSIGATADVLITGASLTAVDIVAGLAARGHKGRIWLASRHGLLPAVRHPIPSHHDFTFLTKTYLHRLASRGIYNLDALIRLVGDEVVAAGHDLGALTAEFRTDEPALQRLHRQLSASSLSGLQILQQAVPQIGQTAWQLLPAADKQYVLTNLHHLVMSLCCPMPLRNAKLLARLADTGQLKVLLGLRSVVPRGEGFHARTDNLGIDAHVAISAVTTAVHPVHHDAQPLINDLVAKGLANADSAGGIQVDPETGRILSSARSQEHMLYALGDLTHGALYFTSGLPVLVDGGATIARAIVATFNTARSSRDASETPATPQRSRSDGAAAPV